MQGDKFFIKRETEYIKPKEFIVEISEDLLPCFEVYIDPGNASKETIQEYFEALNDLNIAAGGLGIEFKIEDIYVLSSAGAIK